MKYGVPYTIIHQMFVLSPVCLCPISALDLKNAPGSIYEGPPQGDKAGCTLTLSDDDFMGFVSGTLNPQKVHIYTNQPLLFLTFFSYSVITRSIDLVAFFDDVYIFTNHSGSVPPDKINQSGSLSDTPMQIYTINFFVDTTLLKLTPLPMSTGLCNWSLEARR